MRIAKKFLHIGESVVFDYGVKFGGAERISIGSEVFIGSNVIINAGKGGNIVINDMVAIAANTTIITRNIDNLGNRSVDRTKNKSVFRDVIIGKGVGIGYNVTINPGVILGEGCEISAGSVVSRNVKPFSIMAGSPAILVGMRQKGNPTLT